MAVRLPGKANDGVPKLGLKDGRCNGKQPEKSDKVTLNNVSRHPWVLRSGIGVSEDHPLILNFKDYGKTET